MSEPQQTQAKEPEVKRAKLAKAGDVESEPQQPQDNESEATASLSIAGDVESEPQQTQDNESEATASLSIAGDVESEPQQTQDNESEATASLSIAGDVESGPQQTQDNESEDTASLSIAGDVESGPQQTQDNESEATASLSIAGDVESGPQQTQDNESDATTASLSKAGAIKYKSGPNNHAELGMIKMRRSVSIDHNHHDAMEREKTFPENFADKSQHAQSGYIYQTGAQNSLQKRAITEDGNIQCYSCGFLIEDSHDEACVFTQITTKSDKENFQLNNNKIDTNDGLICSCKAAIKAILYSNCGHLLFCSKCFLQQIQKNTAEDIVRFGHEQVENNSEFSVKCPSCSQDSSHVVVVKVKE